MFFKSNDRGMSGRLAKPGRYAPRECVRLSSSALCAIAHWGERSSIPETAVIEPRGHGVLDTRLRGYDGGGCGARFSDVRLHIVVRRLAPPE